MAAVLRSQRYERRPLDQSCFPGMLRPDEGNLSYHGHSIGVRDDYQLHAGFDAGFLVRRRSTSTNPVRAVSQKFSKRIADDRMARLNRKAPLPTSCEPITPVSEKSYKMCAS